MMFQMRNIWNKLLLLSSLTLQCESSVKWYTFGDWGAQTIQQLEVAAAMDSYAEEFQPEFIIALGDNFYDNGITSVDDPNIDLLWREPYNLPNLHQAGLPWWLVVGNHDYGLGFGEEWNQVALSDVDPLWNMPNLYYEHTFTDGQITVQLIMVDSEALWEDMNNHTVMMEWLNNTLEMSTADWVIVGDHHPVFSCDTIPGDMYDKLLPTLDYHRQTIDVFMSGHLHNVQLLQKTNDPGYFDFVISGAGALPSGENFVCETPQYGIDKVFVEVIGSFTTMEATPEFLNITYIDSNLATMYSYTRYKVPGTPGSIYDPPPTQITNQIAT